MNSWLISQFHPTNPGFWIVVSLLAWLPIKLVEGRCSARQLRWLNLARWVLIPYAGLLAGSLSPQLMGVTGIDWRVTFGVGIVLAVGLIALLAAVRVSLHSAKDTVAEGAKSEKRQAESLRSQGWSDSAIAILMAGAEQFQWSFLRGAVWEIMLLRQVGIEPVEYWAVWIAALLALPEILLQPLTLADRTIKVAILAMTAVLFIFTQSFWLCWALHASAWLLLTTMLGAEGKDPSTSVSG